MANNTREIRTKVYGEIRVVTPDEYLTYIAKIEAGEIEPGALRGTGSGLTVYYKMDSAYIILERGQIRLKP